MGDYYEFTTWPKHQHVFYYVNAGGLAVDIKAPGYAAIGLAKKPGNTCDYWIGIGEYNHCWIKRTDGNRKTAFTPDVLSADEYRNFWLQWTDGFIRLGKGGDTEPLIAHTNKIPALQYVTFGALRDHNSVYWKIILSPLDFQALYLKPISEGRIKWIEMDNFLPKDAVIGGYEDEPVYIIRAAHEGSLTPGKFVPSKRTGFIPYGGQSIAKAKFEVLCGFDCTWISSREDRVPPGAVEVGYYEQHNDYHERPYIGRASHEGHIIPGKVMVSHKVCYIPYQSREIAKTVYEILVEPNNNTRCVNKYYMPDVRHISDDTGL